MGLYEDPVSLAEFLRLAEGAQFMEQADGGCSATQVMMLRGPEYAPAGDRLRQALVDGLLKERHVCVGEVAGLADLVINDLSGGIIVQERRLESSREGRDSVSSFSHG